MPKRPSAEQAARHLAAAQDELKAKDQRIKELESALNAIENIRRDNDGSIARHIARQARLKGQS